MQQNMFFFVAVMETCYILNKLLCFRDNMSVDWKLNAVTRVSLKTLDSET